MLLQGAGAAARSGTGFAATGTGSSRPLCGEIAGALLVVGDTVEGAGDGAGVTVHRLGADGAVWSGLVVAAGSAVFVWVPTVCCCALAGATGKSGSFGDEDAGTDDG